MSVTVARMVQRVVIIGAGGFGREVLDVLDDRTPDPGLLAPYGVAHLGPAQHLAELEPDVGYVIGLGAPPVRERLDQLGLSLGRSSPVLVHPTASVGRRAVELGPGSIVCANASITNHVRLGRHVHVNLNSTIGHDAT